MVPTRSKMLAELSVTGQIGTKGGLFIEDWISSPHLSSVSRVPSLYPMAVASALSYLFFLIPLFGGFFPPPPHQCIQR